ncbi:SUKH-3 domain-containing protein [Lysobacter capsici]|uniref:SUKH-3 domain-containing protein n=1 Tax=Lysobacter capsici TaxID=435897 RepID=UPI001C00587E|nr:SUKH-3 domain-containing protein [Lysobacter capsici]QWF15012.1 SUKH-3 domain-containing protein [Lysobacter capsici]
MPWTFDAETRAVLQRHGWRGERSVATDAIQRAWQDDGYDVFAGGLRFARSFAGLRLRHPSWSGADGDESVFDPILASARFDRAWASERYQPAAKQRLLPIGQGYSAHLTYLIGDDGAIFGGYDDSLRRFGDSVEDALGNILLRRNQRIVAIALD